MLIKFENNLFSFALLLMLYQVMVRAAVVKPSNNSVISQNTNEVIPLTAANVRRNVFIPSHVESPGMPYSYSYNYPNDPNTKNYNTYNDETDSDPSGHPMLRKGDEFPLEEKLPVEDPDYPYYAENPQYDNQQNKKHNKQYYKQYNNQYNTESQPKTTKKPKKIYKAIERVYYYPHNSDSEVSRSKSALNQMKDYIPEEHQDEDDQDDPDENLQDEQEMQQRRDYKQMNNNPPRLNRAEHEEPEEVYASDGIGDGSTAQMSIANDVKDFGREAVDEAKSFEGFLDKLKNFADNSEKEYLAPNEGMDEDDSTGLQDNEETPNSNPRYSDSMAAHTADDKTRDYETVSNFGKPDEYDSEKTSYQNQNSDQKGGHRYHKDRRRPRKSNVMPDAEYERRNKEVSGLIDSEPEEADYLSNFDVVKQMKNSERKYNTGIDPVYSSKRDFDEVTRLEKMIENVALLNKQKEKAAQNAHDVNEGTEGTEGSDGREGREGSESKIDKVVEKEKDNKSDKKEKS